jgi:hypothetical protein
MAQRIDLVGCKLLLFSLLPRPRSLSCRKNSCDMGDWVAHPSNTTAKRIFVTYSFRAAVSGEGSPEPPGVRMNNFILCPMIIVFRMNNASSCVQWSLFFLCFLLPLAECSCKPKVQVELGRFVVSLQARNKFYKPSTKMELVQWPRATRLTTCRQDRCECMILHILSWRYGRIVTLFWCINDDCNLCVCDFSYRVMKIWPHCNLALMYQWRL